jgi:3-oxoadipate enol-lactonase
MPKVDLQHAQLNYELTGLEAVPVLMLSNSLGTDLRMWDAQLASFEQHYRVLRYDMRGHGASSVPPGPYTMDQLGNDVLGLLNMLDIPRVHFCGLSIGGAIGQWLGIHAAPRLHKLILCNTAAKIGTEQTWNSRIADVNQHGLQAIADATMQRWFTPGFRSANPSAGTFQIQMMRDTLLAVDPIGYTASCAAIRDIDQREAVGRIEAPVCIIAGSQDPVTTVADAEFLRSHIPGAELHILPAAHISNVEAHELFNTTVLNFLAKEVPK